MFNVDILVLFKYMWYYLWTCLQWLWCLSVLCEVAFACDLATVDCIMTAEMFHTLAILLESAAECRIQTQCPGKEFGSTIVFFQSEGQLKSWTFCLGFVLFYRIPLWHLIFSKLPPQSHTRMFTRHVFQTIAVILLFSCIISSSSWSRQWWCEVKYFFSSWGMWMDWLSMYRIKL